MAGMLPGVECARRRRLGTSTDSPVGSRRSSFCLYAATGHDQSQLGRCSSMPQRRRSSLSKESRDESLGLIAREAKERLDARLRMTNSCRSSSSSSDGAQVEEQSSILGNIGRAQREVFAGNKGGRRFSWSKMGWEEAPEKADCAVCLEDFAAGEILVHLPCAHRFHWNCALPWLESSSHCPCCRMAVSSSSEA